MADPWQIQMTALGEFIRTQRKMADLSLRELAELTEVSNPYLSQVERGLHQPSVRVLKAIAKALNMSAETLLMQAGLLEPDACNASDDEDPVEAAIRVTTKLTDEQREALIGLYRTMARPPTPPGNRA
jgi:transcriptional regulator with XRE-family HTH domain